MYRQILLSIVYTYYAFVAMSPCLFIILTKGTGCFQGRNNLYTTAKQCVSNIEMIKELPVIQKINYVLAN